MSAEAIQMFFAFAVIAGLLVMFVSMLGLRLTLTPRIKKQLAAAGNQWNPGIFDFGFAMTILLAWACVLLPVRRTVRFQSLFPGLNIRASANWLEKVFAFGLIGGLMVLILCTALFHLVKP